MARRSKSELAEYHKAQAEKHAFAARVANIDWDIPTGQPSRFDMPALLVESGVEGYATQETGDLDEGYRAANTLSGTRMNASLFHTPAAISVLTKEFLDDIGAINVSEALEYGLNGSRDTTDYTGNAADVHGPFLHPNGRLYWCHGRKGYKAAGKDGKVVFEGKSSGIWSVKPDGTDVQWHALLAGDNPVEVDFTPQGEVIGVQNLYYGQPRGDTIVHWLSGGVYERVDLPHIIAGLPRTLPTMPVMHNFGHVAVSGACFWKSFPEIRGTDAPLQFLVTHFNTQRVVRMELVPQGATYRAVENEFLKLDDPDVHFTDVIEAPDGSLIVLNTGGWFRLGCPASLMAKPDVLGSILRIRPTGKPTPVAGAWQTPYQQLRQLVGGTSHLQDDQ